MQNEISKILKVCKSRRELGKRKYGDNDFLNKDVLNEAIDELYDFINYALFQIIKLKKLQKNCKKIEKE